MKRKPAEFVEGAPCSKGHTLRYANGGCVECARARRRAWYYRNRDVSIETSRKWKERNSEYVTRYGREYRDSHRDERRRLSLEWHYKNHAKSMAQSKEWRLRNPGKASAQCRRWAQENPDRRAAIYANRRAAKMRRTVAWADQRRITAMYAVARRVSRCLGIEFHVDHIVPLQGKFVSGLHCEDNLRIVPAAINLAKYNKFDGDD